MQRDPVCGMMVDEKKGSKSEHDGTAYYFCSSNCKNEFDRDPHKFGHSH
jgi:YHS domain-containing protein